jgi:hypothetical protein
MKPEFVKPAVYWVPQYSLWNQPYIEYLSTVSTFNTPEVKCSDSVRLRGFVKQFGEKYFATDVIILFCKLCEVKVTVEKRFAVQHCSSAKHISCANTDFAAESKQRLLFEKSHSSSSILSSAYEFSKNLCKIMV